MLESKRKVTLHVNVDSEMIKLFDAAYPAARTRFIQNAIEVALSDKLFFDKVFWKNLLPK